MDPLCEMIHIYLMRISSTGKCEILPAIQLYCETNVKHTYIHKRTGTSHNETQ